MFQSPKVEDGVEKSFFTSWTNISELFLKKLLTAINPKPIELLP